MIRYAGVHTLLPTPELEAWVNANLPLGVAQYFCRSGDGIDFGVSGSFMPGNTWPQAPQPRINTLYWPTGASRWASMLLLVDADMMDIIVDATSPEFTAGLHSASAEQLVLADSGFTGTITDNSWSESTDRKHVAMSTAMYALTPHPISDELWVLPIVDERWFWQFIKLEGGSNDIETWSDVLDDLEGKTGGTWVPDDIDTEYVTPIDLNDYPTVKLGTAIDAVCRQIGHRFIRRVTLENRTYRFGPAATQWDANTVDPDSPTPFSIWNRLAGGEFTYRSAASMPQYLRINDNGAVFSPLIVETKDVGATAFSGNANITMRRQGSVPGVTDVQWAERVATDWVGWRNEKKADQAFIGVKAWHTTGYEDCVIIAMGNCRESPSTRIITLPENFGVDYWAGGTNVACRPAYELRHWYFPSSGDSEIEVTYNAVTETITLPFNATPSQVKTAIDAHTEMVSASVECTASSVPGGNLWRSSVIVRMPDGGTIGLGATPDGDLAPDASTDYEPHITVVECGCQ